MLNFKIATQSGIAESVMPHCCPLVLSLRFHKRKPDMNPQIPSNRFLQLRADLDQFQRYYEAMRRRCERWSFALWTLCVLTAFATFLAVIGELSAPLTLSFSFLTTICSCLLLAERASNQADSYQNLRESFLALAEQIPTEEGLFSAELVKRLMRQKSKLEADKPPVYGCLFTLCRIEAYNAIGIPDEELNLTWMQHYLWRFFPIPYKRRKMRSNKRNEHSSEKENASQHVLSPAVINTLSDKFPLDVYQKLLSVLDRSVDRSLLTRIQEQITQMLIVNKLEKSLEFSKKSIRIQKEDDVSLRRILLGDLDKDLV